MADVAELRVKVKADLRELEEGLNRGRQKVKEFAGDVAPAENALRKLGGAAEEAAMKLRAEPFERFGQWAKSAGATLTTAVTLPLAAVGAAATKMAVDFDQSMANVNSLLKQGADGAAALRAQVLTLSQDPRITQGPRELAAGLYDVVSSGFQGQEALDVLRQAAYGATAGLTDTATAGRVLMAVLNSGIPGVQGAREAMDVLFREVDLGVNSFEELANALGDVLPTAVTAGVSLQEVTSALAVMTRGGISVNESVTALNQLLIHIIKPSDDAAKLMKSLGIEFGAAALQSKGLAGWLEQVQSAAGGNTQALTEMMPEIRGMKALLSLTRGDGEAFAEMIREMAKATDGAGSTQGALNKQLEGMGAQIKDLQKDLEAGLIKGFEAIQPVAKDLISKFDALVEDFGKLSLGQRKAIVEFGLLAAAIGPALLALGSLASALATLITNWGALRGAILAARALILGPWGAALVVAGLAISAYAGNWLGLRDTVDSVVGSIGERIARLVTWSENLRDRFSRWGPGVRWSETGLGAASTDFGSEAVARERAAATPPRWRPVATRRNRTGTGGGRVVLPPAVVTPVGSGGGGRVRASAEQIRLEAEQRGRAAAQEVAAIAEEAARTAAEALARHMTGGAQGARVLETRRRLGLPQGLGLGILGDRVSEAGPPAPRELVSRLGEYQIEPFRGLVPQVPETDPFLLLTMGQGLAGAMGPWGTAGQAWGGAMAAATSGAVERMKRQNEAALQAARTTRRLGEAVADARAEWDRATGQANLYEQELARLNLATRDLTEGQQRMVAEIARIRDVTRMAADVGRSIGQAFGSALLDRSEKFFVALRQRVIQVLQQIAAETIARQVSNWVTQAAGMVIGAAFGGYAPSVSAAAAGAGASAGLSAAGADIGGSTMPVAGLAAGGPVSPGRAYVVGERGPELFVPREGGQIIRNGAGNVTIHMTVVTPDPGAFRASQNQIAQDAWAAIRRVMARG